MFARRFAFPAVTALLTFLVLAHGHAAVWRVDADAPGPTHDGTSWAQAFPKVQAGISAARPGDEVWVARGVYVENLNVPPGIRLLGGFAGGETAREQRDSKANATVLDGGLLGTVVTIAAGAGRDTVVDGFTVRNGTDMPIGPGSNFPYRGGGFQIVDSSPTIANVVVEENWSDSGAAGICCAIGSPVIQDCTFRNNTSRFGGSSVFCVIGSGAILLRNDFRANATLYGDAKSSVYISQSSPEVRDCFFDGPEEGIAIWSGSPGIVGNTLVHGAILALGISNNDGASGSSVVVNNIIALGGQIHDYTANDKALTATYRNNCIWPYQVTALSPRGALGQHGNISADPRFVDAEGGDYRLRSNSPCIDAGDSSVVQEGETDLSGRPRIVGPAVDIGAYESTVSAGTGAHRIVRVKPGGDDTDDGSSWDRAMRTIQAAIANVSSRTGGEVWVAAGTYRENLLQYGWVSLYGGFAGREQRRDQRNWSVNRTVIDGGARDAVVRVVAGATAAIVLDGFTIRNGLGGGIWLESTSPTVSHNVIESNVSGLVRTTKATRYMGGGILIRDGSPAVRNNVILGNTAEVGGGVGVIGPTAAPVLVNNTIVSNSAGDGGGLAALEGARFTLVNNLIAHNASGLYSDTASAALSLQNNLLYGNVGYEVRGVADPAGRDGNLRADPRLANLPFGDFHIQPNSPCRDAGDNSAVLPGDRDIDGQPRILGPAFGAGRSRVATGRVDIGADESDGRIFASWPPAVVRVSLQGDDRRSGHSWASAKRTIQAAIDAAAAKGGEVWVARGVYTGSITVPPNVYLYGGFSGRDPIRNRGKAGETPLFGRDVQANLTVLDGGGRTGESIPPVVSLDGRGGGAGLDGFTVRNAGYSTRPPKPLPRFGSAVSVTGTVTLAGNAMVNNPGTGILGIYATATLTGNIVAGNSTVANNGIGAPEGGASFRQSTVVLDHNTVAANGTPYSRAGVLLDHCALRLLNNNITGNGGAGVSTSNSYGLIRNNVVKGNRAGLYASTSELSVVNNTFLGNTFEGYTGSPYAGLSFLSDKGSTVANNLIAYNRAATQIQSGMPEFRNNAFFGNAAAPNEFPGTGNILADPKIASVRYGDVHLQPGSPLIDRGDPSVADTGGTDMDGQPRLLGARVDIGADESDGTTWMEAPRIVRVAPDGNDALDGASWTQAKGTVNGAMAALAEHGGEVWLAAGVYPERVIMNQYASLYGGFDGSEAQREDRDWNRNASILDGGGYATVVTVLSGAPENRVDGLTIRNGGSSANFGPGPAGGVTLYAPVTLAHNLITGNRAGAVACWNTSPLITQNRIVDNSSTDYSGFGIYAIGSSATITSNLIARNRTGITCRETNGLIVSNNTVVSNGAGISLEQDNRASFRNNIVAFNRYSGFYSFSWNQPVGALSHNDVIGNQEGNWSGVQPGSTNLSVDPLFADAAGGDYHLSAASPLIDLGLDSAVAPGAEDLDGAPRIQGAHVDIGAYEIPQ